ncbi:hypothetical protein AMAG_04221 [Allomyces macrogynus ATCC 38327]|uniref:Uncharacterized protein n=1 Tax=Allomyces macrogynus (strain ATCC 38327) TaxID=578462 RepID=A0A0L0S8G3_ALLM3|nr:hypothetical protein AMAG_04221 [Allomyces macrogynus ATCC 38327]|eukprot:KNE58664.1 hypothetical protein AMAG_04221 [Allomyces macrogynus ATCC 38327]
MLSTARHVALRPALGAAILVRPILITTLSPAMGTAALLAVRRGALTVQNRNLHASRYGRHRYSRDDPSCGRAGWWAAAAGPRVPDSPGRSAVKFGASVAAGVLAFAVAKPLILTVLGAGLGYGAFRVTRTWLDLRFPPRYPQYYYQHPVHDTDPAGGTAKEADPYANDPVAQWLKDMGVPRNPPTPGTADPMAAVFFGRMARMGEKFARTMAAAHPALLDAPSTVHSLVVEEITRRDSELARAVVLALNAPGVNDVRFAAPTSVSRAITTTTSETGGATTSATLEIGLDAISSTSGSMVGVVAGAEVPDTTNGRVHLKWVRVANGPTVNIDRWGGGWVDAAAPPKSS